MIFKRLLNWGSFPCFSQEYEKALKYVRILLKNEPGNKQAIELEKLINQALRKGTCAWESARACVCAPENVCGFFLSVVEPNTVIKLVHKQCLDVMGICTALCFMSHVCQVSLIFIFLWHI